jgi:hypothetical protein
VETTEITGLPRRRAFQEVPIFAEPNFGLISVPRWSQKLQTNLLSMSDSQISSPQPSALVSM